MSTAFGTSNICWVPEGGVFRFLDLYHWAEWRLDLDRWRLSLSPEAANFFVEQASEGLRLCRIRAEANENDELSQSVDHAERFVTALGRIEGQPGFELTDVGLPTGPLVSLWIRLSDMPLESFHSEDYRPHHPESDSVARIASVGAVALPGCDELEIPYLSQVGESLGMLTPTLDCVAEYPLPADAMLPIFDEYCGFRGNSNQGKMVNLGLDGCLAPENPVALPLYQIEGGTGFVTLYLHFQTPRDRVVSMPIRRHHTVRVEATLAEQGFERHLQMGRNGIWQRGGDWVHTIWAAPGLESEMVPALPPIFAVARAHASREPADREALLTDLLKMALGGTSGPRH